MICLYVTATTLSLTTIAYGEGWSEAGNSLPPEPTADQARNPSTWEKRKRDDGAPLQTPHESKNKKKKNEKKASPHLTQLEMLENQKADDTEIEDLNSDYSASFQEKGDDTHFFYPDAVPEEVHFLECELSLSGDTFEMIQHSVF